MKNRTIIGIVCVVLSLVLVFGGNIIVNKTQSKTVMVLSASVDIQKGQKIPSTSLKITEINDGAVSLSNSWKYKNEEEAQAAIAQFVDVYATVDIMADDVITPEKVTTSTTNIDAALEGLDGEKVAMSVKIASGERQLSGKLEVGDVVSLIITDRETSETTIPLAFRYLKIVGLTTSGGIDSEDVVKNDDGSYTFPATVTFLLTPMQAAMLAAEVAENNPIYYTLAYRGDAETAKEFTDVTDKYMEGLETTAQKMAQAKLGGNISTSNEAFNSYYEAHKTEFVNVLDDIFEEVYGMHIETAVSDESAFEEDTPAENTTDQATADAGGAGED